MKAFSLLRCENRGHHTLHTVTDTSKAAAVVRLRGLSGLPLDADGYHKPTPGARSGDGVSFITAEQLSTAPNRYGF